MIRFNLIGSWSSFSEKLFRHHVNEHRPFGGAGVQADKTHAFGHEKIEFFSSGFEGGLIGVAGLGTIWYAVDRLIHPQELAKLDIGSGIALAAALVNFAVAFYLLRVGKSRNSIILIANGKHLMTDVYTSIGVVLAAPDGKIVDTIARSIGRTTNNIAEYEAVRAGLERARELGAHSVHVRADSELAIRQLTGVYQVKNEQLKPLFDQVKALESMFAGGVTFEHVRREYNRQATNSATPITISTMPASSRADIGCLNE